MSDSTDPRINLKDPWVAAVLAWLVPGAGHFYQGRTFKAAIFFFCILGTFMYGLALGDWQGVYFQTENPVANRRRAYGYFAQIGVGVGSLPALMQYRRFYSADNSRSSSLTSPLDVPFVGEMDDIGPEGGVRRFKLQGRLDVRPIKGEIGPEVDGTFRGTMEEFEKNDPQQVELKIAGGIVLGPPIGPEAGRPVKCYSPSTDPGHALNPREIHGEIPRSFIDRAMVPLEEDALQHLHGRLGKRLEIALVFTWIAGLLNVLAVWDAFEGPAYGYGDEPETPATGDGQPPPTDGQTPANAAAPQPSRSTEGKP